MPDPTDVEHGVFSAHAEVVPSSGHDLTGGLRILRARGGSSAKKTPIGVLGAYSPRTRR